MADRDPVNSASRAGGIVVVLFTDLVGSTETASRIGPAATERLRHEHFTLLRRAINENAGTEVKNLGDGIVATFPSASAAVDAAIRIQQDAERHNRRAEPARLDIRTAIDAGEAVQEGDDWFGEPMVVASRMCGVAAGGEILITEVIRTLMGRRSDLQMAHRGDLELKGIPDAIAGWSVAWEPAGSQHEVPRALSQGAGAFVGRSREAEDLRRLWKAASTGRRQAALVAGEPGVGKTRLAADLAVTVHAEGARVLYGRCDEETPAAYQPFVEALGPLVAEIDASRGEWKGLAALFPQMAQGGLADPQLTDDPEVERQLLFDAVATVLASAVSDAPLLVVIDDLHWAARPTVLLLRHLLRSNQLDGVMVLGTYRDTDLDRTHPLADTLADLRRVPDVERVLLRGLDVDGVVAFVEAAAGQTLEGPALDLARAVHAQTEGNPLFVGEVLRHLVETGVVVQRDGRWTSDIGVDELPIPEGVREVIGRRLSRLSREANDALAVGAIIGRDFDLDIVEVVTELDGDKALEAVEEAAARGVVSEQRGRPGRFTFSHALVQEALVSELSSARLARLHRRVGEAIEALHAKNLDPWFGALARHFAEAARAGQVDKAVTYALAAHQQAMDRLAFEDALAIADRAAHVLELDDEPDVQQVFEVTLARCAALRRFGGLLGEDHVVELAAAARAVGTGDALGRAAKMARWAGTLRSNNAVLLELPEEALAALPDEPTPLRAGVLAAYGYQLTLVNDPRGREVAKEAFELGLQLRDPDAISSISTIAAFQHGSLDTAEQQRVSDILLEFGDELGPQVRGVGYYLRCFATLGRGERDALEETIADLRSLGERSRLIVHGFWGVQWSGVLALADGRFDDLETLDQQSQALLLRRTPSNDLAIAAPLLISALEQGHHEVLVAQLPALGAANYDVPVVRAALAMVEAEMRDVAAVEARLEQLVTPGLPRLDRDITYGGALAFLATAAAEIGHGPSAAILTPELEPFSGQLIPCSFSVCVGAADRFLGMLASIEGEHDRAEELLGRAVALEEEGLRGPALGARTRYWRAVAAERRGDVELARDRARDARERAEGLRAHGITRLCDAVLARIG